MPLPRKAAIPVLRKQGSGHIIQLSSVGGRVGAMGRAPYSAAKWGVEGFSEVLAKEMAPLGIRVSIMEPGGFRTDFAGSSTTINEGRPEYDSIALKMGRLQSRIDLDMLLPRASQTTHFERNEAQGI